MNDSIAFFGKEWGLRIELGSFASTLARTTTRTFATLALMGAEGVSFVHQASFRV